MTRLPLVLLVVLLLGGSALGVAACGADDVPGVEDVKTAAADRCREEAAKIRDVDSRRTAETACDALGGEASGKDVENAARQQCVNAAKQIQDDTARERALAACRG